MSQVDYYSTERRTLWERLFGSLVSRPEGEMTLNLPSDSLFASTWGGGPSSVADVPDQVKAQIREEALLDTFNRLEASLRLLLYATTPGKEPPTAERCHQILNVWRYELEHRLNLVPDTYCGAVQRYEPEMEASYTIDGRCEMGDLLRIRVPCWRMYDRIVIRGEAEILDEAEAQAHQDAEARGEAPSPATPLLGAFDLPKPEEASAAAAVSVPVEAVPEPAPEVVVKVEAAAESTAEAAAAAEPEGAAGLEAGAAAEPAEVPVEAPDAAGDEEASP